jgi:hypothetical protein
MVCREVADEGFQCFAGCSSGSDDRRGHRITGSAGQLVSPGHVWSGGGWFTDSVVLHGGVSSLPAVPAWPGSMTDGGVHYRYPNYSYRYPWNHPGPAVPHVNIVW